MSADFPIKKIARIITKVVSNEEVCREKSMVRPSVKHMLVYGKSREKANKEITRRYGNLAKKIKKRRYGKNLVS